MSRIPIVGNPLRDAAYMNGQMGEAQKALTSAHDAIVSGRAYYEAAVDGLAPRRTGFDEFQITCSAEQIEQLTLALGKASQAVKDAKRAKELLTDAVPFMPQVRSHLDEHVVAARELHQLSSSLLRFVEKRGAWPIPNSDRRPREIELDLKRLAASQRHGTTYQQPWCEVPTAQLDDLARTSVSWADELARGRHRASQISNAGIEHRQSILATHAAEPIDTIVELIASAHRHHDATRDELTQAIGQMTQRNIRDRMRSTESELTFPNAILRYTEAGAAHAIEAERDIDAARALVSSTVHTDLERIALDEQLSSARTSIGTLLRQARDIGAITDPESTAGHRILTTKMGTHQERGGTWLHPTYSYTFDRPSKTWAVTLEASTFDPGMLELAIRNPDVTELQRARYTGARLTESDANDPALKREALSRVQTILSYLPPGTTEVDVLHAMRTNDGRDDNLLRGRESFERAELSTAGR